MRSHFSLGCQEYHFIVIVVVIIIIGNRAIIRKSAQRPRRDAHELAWSPGSTSNYLASIILITGCNALYQPPPRKKGAEECHWSA